MFVYALKEGQFCSAQFCSRERWLQVWRRFDSDWSWRCTWWTSSKWGVNREQCKE